MAKLIREFVDIKDLQIIKEEGEKIGCHSTQKYFIQGPFMTAESKNLNGRVYPRNVMEKAVNKYNEEYVKTGRAVSELDHPETATIQLSQASHIITELGFKDPKDHHVYGKARVLDPEFFPMAKILYGYLKEGIIMGISSRGVGSLSEGIVGEDYTIVGCDIVLSPSGKDCYLEGILESKDFEFQGNMIVECAVRNLRETVDKKYNSKDNLKYLMSFLQDIQMTKGK